MQDNGGERELVLGNKQLLAIFFVAALLCGVFFAVGYVVGGNSAKAGAAALTADGSSAATPEGKHEEQQPEAATETPAASTPIQTATPAPADAGGTLPPAEPMVSSNPAAAGAQPPTIPPASVPAAPAPKPAAPAAQAAKPDSQAAKPAASGVSISVPEAGAQYWQVIATSRPHADDLVISLREAGMPAILAVSGNPDLIAVLVGPYRSAISFSEAKKKLIALGFNGVFPHKK